MRIDKVLLVYAGADLLFVLGGVLLIVASLVFGGKIDASPNLESAPDILLLKMVPFKGLLPFTANRIHRPGCTDRMCNSGHRELHLRLRHIRHIHSRNDRARQSILAEASGLDDARMCHIHARARRDRLVRDVGDACRAGDRLGPTDHRHAESASAEGKKKSKIQNPNHLYRFFALCLKYFCSSVRLLRLFQQQLPTLRHR